MSKNIKRVALICLLAITGFITLLFSVAYQVIKEEMNDENH
ncbi:hypothetical protein [Macrococcoides goetzii]|nr:hypothetical protein [Macrococcus goetzii]